MELSVEDDIENRFPDLVANLNQDSDELFDSLLTSKNINFTRSTTCLIDDFQLNQSTPRTKSSRPVSMNSLYLTTSNTKSRKSLEKDCKMRRSVNIQSNNKNSPLSSKTTLKPIDTNTLDRYKPRTVEDFVTTNFSRPSQRNQENTFSETSSFKNSLYEESCDLRNLSQGRLLKTQSTHSPCISSVQNYLSSKLVPKETITNNSENPISTDGRLKSCMKEKQKDSSVSGSSSPFHNITFRNKSSQKKGNAVVWNCLTDPEVIENHSLASKFNLVSAINSSPIPTSSMSIASKIHNEHFNIGLLQTPVGRCSRSFMKTPNRRSHLKDSGLAKSNNKTPTLLRCCHLSCKKPEKSKSLTGVKKLHKSTSEKKLVSKRISVNEDISLVEEDDMPCTQPISEIILRGVVAYVEIRSDNEYRNEGVKAELESLGAKVEKNFTKKVTHCFFRGGRMSTYKRAVDWKVPLVCVLWIEACKAELRQVPLKGYEPHGMDRFQEALALYRPRTRIRRPVTDSKVLAKLRKPTANSVKKVAPTKNPPKPLGPPSQTGKLIEALHSVAVDLKKATHQFEKILTSPILQNKASKMIPTSPRTSEMESSEDIFEEKKKRRNKKLIFASSSDEDCKGVKTQNNKPSDEKSSLIDNDGNEIRVSYDSDDLLVYAKKQAANTRCSAPARLLTNRKCKKLLTSCQKAIENKIDKKSGTNLNHVTNGRTAENSKGSPKNCLEKSKTLASDGTKRKVTPKTRKRKLMVPAQVIAAFEQDSSESISEASDVSCPYQTSNKRQRDVKGKFAKPLPVPAVTSDWESDDSLTRAARRESSALFVKKEKKPPGQRLTPTIVCTSLSKSDVEVVASIAATLGRFVVEPVVSERTTHVVTSSSRRTINLLKAIARGCWVLNVKWVYESLEAGKWLHEERFELTSFSPAVKQARLERQAFGPEFSLELFERVGAVYVCRTTSPPAADLAELLRLCGATVVSSARAARVLVGSARPFSPTFSTRQPLVVTERWVLDSVTRLTLLDPHDYAVDQPET